jgi:hypothetical protein
MYSLYLTGVCELGVEKALFEALTTLKTPYLSSMEGLTNNLSAKQAALAKIPKVVAPKAWPFK